MIAGYYEDIEVGQKFRSRGRTITDAYVLQFAMLSGDWHPLHTDTEFAKQGPFGGRIAHGMLTLAATTGLMTLSPDSVEAFYGMDRVRFLRPVHLEDTICVLSEITEKDPLKDGVGTVVVKVTVINQREEAVLAMSMRFVVASHDRGKAQI